MSELNTTSIHDLPTDPTGGGSIGGNVSLVANETNKYKNQVIGQGPGGPPGPGQGQGMTLDQSTISQIVNGLQQASVSGATALPSRDIPSSTESMTHDPATNVNYVPPPEQHSDYISSEPAMYDYPEERVKNALDSVYDEIQAPLMLAVLYFLFQLPIMRKTIFKYVPILCTNDGNYNLNGLVFTSIMFGMLYFSLTKTMVQFNKF
jgi:hypothetical protein